MSYRSRLYVVIYGVLLFIVAVLTKPPKTLSRNERFPNRDELDVCGTIRDVIVRNSGRFFRILIRNTNNEVEYENEDARFMTSRAKSKLDVLASLVNNVFKREKLRVIQAWTDQVRADDPISLHYEGMLF